MYSLIHQYPLRTVLTEHAPSMIIAFVIAEVFYKFHSFTLECTAFLITWYLLSALQHWLLNLKKHQVERPDRSGH